MALPTRDDFQRLEHTIATRLDRLIELAEQGALTTPTADTIEVLTSTGLKLGEVRGSTVHWDAP